MFPKTRRILSIESAPSRPAPPPRARASGPSTDLDAIMGAMSRQEAKRTATASLNSTFFAEQQSMKRQREAAGMAHLASQIGVVRCNSSASSASSAAPTANAAEAADAAETAEVVGAATDVAMISDTFEARMRSQVVNGEEPVATVVRDRRTQTLENRQKTIAKQSHAASISLTAAQKSRRDKTIVKLHRLFLQVGRDPDDCSVCADVTKLCVRLFLRAAGHALVCAQCDAALSSMLECPAAILFQPASVLAPACLTYFFESEDCERHQQQIGSAAFDKIKVEMQGRVFVAKNPSQNRAQQLVVRAMGWLLKSSDAEVCKRCEPKLDVQLPVSSEREISRYAGIVQSAVVMGWISPECCDLAMEVMSTPAFQAFHVVGARWPADLVAMSLLVAVGADRDAVSLAKLCAQAQLSLTTVERAMALLKPPPVAGGP